MRGKVKNVALLVVVLVFMPIAWVSIFTGEDLGFEDLVEKRLADLRDRLHHAETLNQERDRDIHMLYQQISLLVNAQGTNNGSSGGMKISKEMREKLANMSMGSSDIQPPGMYHYLPHLIGKQDGLAPAVKLAKGRMGVSVVIGIPTIKREKELYLMQTLTSLLEGLNEEEKDDALVIVFIAEDEDYASGLAAEIQKTHGHWIDLGLLEVISPPNGFYPNLDNLKETFGDSKERVKWRTKQNLDFSFLMMYARSRGTYYVQLEDDVVTKPGYLSTMKNFALNQKTEDWMLLEFSHLGFIGKLFKSSDLPMVVEFFLMFHRDKPIDWLLDHLLYVKVCNPEKDNKHCQRSVAEMRRRFKPSLFQHIGTHSSLKGKVQKLKDKDFGKTPLHRAHINPNAEVSSTIKIYQRYSLDRAYIGETFFWGLIPRPGDVVVFKFNPPIFLESYLFKSGNPEHPGDRFFNTTVEVLPREHTEKQEGQLDNKNHNHPYPKTEDQFLIIGNFSHNTGIAKGSLDGSLGFISTMRLRILAESQSWVILNEIHIKAKKQS